MQRDTTESQALRDMRAAARRSRDVGSDQRADRPTSDQERPQQATDERSAAMAHALMNLSAATEEISQASNKNSEGANGSQSVSEEPTRTDRIITANSTGKSDTNIGTATSSNGSATVTVAPTTTVDATGATSTSATTGSETSAIAVLASTTTTTKSSDNTSGSTTAAPTSTPAPASTSTSSAATEEEPSDSFLLPGWQRVIHDSGLPCFVNEELQIVTWSKPYAIDAMGGDFVAMATTHVPPLSLFGRRMASPAQLAAQRQATEDMAAFPQSRSRGSSSSRLMKRDLKKRKAGAALAVAGDPTIEIVRDAEDALPMVEINGRLLEDPRGKSVHVFLKEFAMAAWGCNPQYSYPMTGDPLLPFAALVRIGRKQYPTVTAISKACAKDGAAEIVLEEHLPGFWAEWKTTGLLDPHKKVNQTYHVQQQIQDEERRDYDNAPSVLNQQASHEDVPSQQPLTQYPTATPADVDHQVRSGQGAHLQEPARKAQYSREPRNEMQHVERSKSDGQSVKEIKLESQHNSDQYHPPHQPPPSQVYQQRQQETHVEDPPVQQQEPQPARDQAPLQHQSKSPPPVALKQEQALIATKSGRTVMTMDEFRALPIGDPRVLVACTELSIKSPVALMQEYVSRHRGLAVHYNTIPHEFAGLRVFKTIATVGSTVAEGIGSSKRNSKQAAAQSLLEVLHGKSVKLYHELVEGYLKGDLPEPKTPIAVAAPERPSPAKKARLSSPVKSPAATMPVAQSSGHAHSQSGVACGWDGFATYGGDANGDWQAPRSPGRDAGAGHVGNTERTVEYYGPSSSSGRSGYYSDVPVPGPSASLHGAAHPRGWSYADRPTHAPPPPRLPPFGVYGPGPGPYGAAPTRLYPPPPRTLSGPPPPGYLYARPHTPSSAREPPYDHNRPKYSTGEVAIIFARLKSEWKTHVAANAPFAQHTRTIQSSRLSRMEGYLLALSKERHAQLWFCVLEHGMLRCYTKPHGGLVETIQLTRHHIRVVVSAGDNDSVCPNHFAVCVVGAQFDEATGKLRVAAGDQERMYRFAAPTADKMRRWARAIHSWRRRAFDASLHDVHDSTSSKDDAVTVRRKMLREEAQTLLYFVTAFDLRLKHAVAKDCRPIPTTNKKQPSSRIFRMSLPLSTEDDRRHNNKENRQSLPATATVRASVTAAGRLKKNLAAWIAVPVVPLPRLRASVRRAES